MTVLSLHNFNVSFSDSKTTNTVVNSIDLTINQGEIVALIGESGSGKSVTAQGITRLIEAAQVSGSAEFMGVDLVKASDEELRKVRQNGISYIFQEPMTALNPLIKCGKQIMEGAHHSVQLNTLLNQVELHDTKRIANSFPHELSGGQRQRIMIAMALAKKPKLIIADEPTTALDIAVQTEILNLIKSICKEEELAVLFITHDLVSLTNFADKTAVMFAGKLVEVDKTSSIMSNPQHDYTKALIGSRATYDKRNEVLAEVQDLMQENEFISKPKPALNVTDTEMLAVNHVDKSHYTQKLFKKDETQVLFDVDFKVNQGDILGIIGESGSGKSTIAKIILQIWDATGGAVHFMDKPLDQHSDLDQQIQIVFQDPYSSLNPKHKIGAAITEVANSIGTKDPKKRTIQLLQEVGLDASDYSKYPHEFSGGQRQRICIAKALAKEPSLLVLDEAVSALDVSVQAKILNLLNRIKEQRNLTYILISHDLNVVSYFCNKIVVLKDGRILEQGSTEQLVHKPTNAYTKELLEHSIY